MYILFKTLDSILILFNFDLLHTLFCFSLRFVKFTPSSSMTFLKKEKIKNAAFQHNIAALQH